MLHSNDRDQKSREVERYLYRVADSAEKENRSYGQRSGVDALKYNLLLEIDELGSWVIKFREHRVLINNSEVVLTSGLVIDATVSFGTLGNFWATINGNIFFEKGVRNTIGKGDALQLFKDKIFSTTVVEDKDSSLSAKSTARQQIKNRKDKGGKGDNNGMAAVPIKTGWLLKKREILHGWNNRYFKVYVGRFEYFMDPEDELPRAVIPLLDAKVSTPRDIRIKKQANILHLPGLNLSKMEKHQQLILEPKYHEKCFMLASQLAGTEGQQEMQSWAMAFEVASKPADKAVSMLGSGRAESKSENNNSPSRTRTTAASAISTPRVIREKIRQSLDATVGPAKAALHGSVLPVVISLVGASVCVSLCVLFVWVNEIQIGSGIGSALSLCATFVSALVIGSAGAQLIYGSVIHLVHGEDNAGNEMHGKRR